ncbi:hypothetical protein SLEP1_g7340 [Rubroshorea leprosula]|uniref:Uncharacterized protein n=1 Tax=Rubroshorea leprosula TaxID=152421 RepID=A0AAV5HY31_9ROSI|nr:hypothetical protein SLEP1_g7340 [Rubroshorea leprosula]
MLLASLQVAPRTSHRLCDSSFPSTLDLSRTHGAITTALGPCCPATHCSPPAELQGCCWVVLASLSPWHYSLVGKKGFSTLNFGMHVRDLLFLYLLLEVGLFISHRVIVNRWYVYQLALAT